MKTQNLRFGEAVKFLASIAGMKPYTFSKKDEEREKEWNTYKEIYKNYVDFFHNELLKNNNSSKAKRSGSMVSGKSPLSTKYISCLPRL